MKIKILISIILISVALPVFIIGQENQDLPKPGLAPDSPFYFFDKVGEKISLFFTPSPEKKAEKALRFAEERLAEAKVMAEKNKTKALAEANQGYQELLNLANQKTKEAKEQGKDVEELAILITEKTLKHQEILIEVFEKVPEEAKTAIEEAIKASRNGSEVAVQTVTGAKKEELLQKIEETRVGAEERISALEEKIKSLEEKLKEKVTESETEGKQDDAQKLQEQLRIAEQKRLEAEKRLAEEKARQEVEKAKTEAEKAKAGAGKLKQEAEETKRKAEEALRKAQEEARIKNEQELQRQLEAQKLAEEQRQREVVRQQELERQRQLEEQRQKEIELEQAKNQLKNLFTQKLNEYDSQLDLLNEQIIAKENEINLIIEEYNKKIAELEKNPWLTQASLVARKANLIQERNEKLEPLYRELQSLENQYNRLVGSPIISNPYNYSISNNYWQFTPSGNGGILSDSFGNYYQVTYYPNGSFIVSP